MKKSAGSHHYLLILFLFIVPLFGNDNTQLLTPALSNESTQKANPEVWLTVFVHGIISIKPHITISNFMRLLTDNVSDSIYAETVDIMRDDPFFFQNQAMQARGLQAIDLSNHAVGSASSLMGNLFEQVHQLSPASPVKNYYYTYGWSGLLSRSARYCDAKDFLKALESEVARFKAQGINPKIRLIGYSHGGSIIIKIALVKQREKLQPSIAIDEALFFGTPIQFETDHLINDPIFKKVYNFFSRGDRIQKLDFFSSGAFFSDRVFKAHTDFDLPDKLVQIEIRMIRKKHEGGKPFCFHDEQQDLLYDGKRCTKNIRNVSPGHTELWFFGWTPLHYRKTFPLYPLPIVAFTPFILNAIKPFEENFKPNRPITVTLDPRRNSMIINNNLCCPQIIKLPFVGTAQLIKFQEEALMYKPDCTIFCKDAYNEHINQAYNEALITIKAKKCKNHDEHIIQYVIE